MNIYQLKSGSWNVRVMIKGKKYSFTFKNKPTQREIDRTLAEKIKEQPEMAEIKGTFEAYAKEYIKIKNNVLSPSTIRAYESIVRNLSKPFITSQIGQITAPIVQAEINNYSATRSPKSTKNASSFIAVVLEMYRPELKLKTKLPQSIRTETYIPEDNDVQKLIAAIRGSKYEAVLLLNMLGLRRSEAIAVTKNDIKKTKEGYKLEINKAKVVTNTGKFVTKTTKTKSSCREIFLPDYVAELIIQNGVAYEGYPNSIARYLHQVQDRIGVPRCKLHALRHYYVSMSHSLGIPDAYIAKAVGHSSTITTRNIYLHAQKDNEEALQMKAANFLKL